MDWSSPERRIQNLLREEKLEKWGWVIYRCTYADDEAWSRFKQIVEQRSHCETLDGASKDQLRARFRAWVAHVIITENPRRDDKHLGGFAISRYEYFVAVCEGALRSVVYDAPQPPEEDMDGKGYVNSVDASWLSINEDPSAAEMSTERQREEQYEPIEDCREENVGWMKMAAWMLTPGFYDAMADNPDVWYCFYGRPRTMVNWYLVFDFLI